MSSQCLTEESLLALMAGDSSPDDWREHFAGCEPCRALWSQLEPVQHALEAGFRASVSWERISTSRARLRDVLGLGGKAVAYYDVWPDSPVGPLFLAVSGQGLCAVSFSRSEEEFLRRLAARGFETARTPESVEGALSQLREYFAGRRRRFEITVDLAGQTLFQRQVLEATAQVPAGQVVSYADIARAIGRHRATRAVGAALGQNPVPIVVPCHRVIGSDGGLHGYGGGLDIKERLLRLEGAAI